MSVIKLRIARKFHILLSKTNVWESKTDEIGHYRIVFIRGGEGFFLLDGQMHEYVADGLIFLHPGQHPVFQEDGDSEVFVISFDTYLADDFQKKKLHSPDFADVYKQAENLCCELKLSHGKPLQNQRDRRTVNYLIDQIIFEITQQAASHVKLAKCSIELIVTILGRNNFESRKTSERSARHILAERIVEYLRYELHQNRAIRIPELLFRFDISEEAANLCVMNKTGMSLRKFINQYKTDLFKSRMLKVDIMEVSTYLRP
jgi:hypothetical protein